MPKSFIAYIRVSTHKQSTHGVSLEEQRRAITEFAHKNDLIITAWYEEITTAAKRGRPVFKSVLQALERAKGDLGLLMHKIDRGARNLRDWADLGEAIDLGVTVRFKQDNVDLQTRGGRLTADIQAVIAADYIRNLREEVKKGIEGRLRQGLYPFKAPVGYLDRGSGKAKVPDPAVAPLIVHAFRLYATGEHSLRSLALVLDMRGLGGSEEHPLRVTQLCKILRNQFYCGTMQVQDRSYPGVHQPLISHELYDRVAQIRSKRQPRRQRSHHFKYWRALRCNACGKFLLGELQKGRVYYRCHDCRGFTVREDRVQEQSDRFSVLQREVFAGSPELEPWEKFESPMVIDKQQEPVPNQALC